jgi:hypothetical protein
MRCHRRGLTALTRVGSGNSVRGTRCANGPFLECIVSHRACASRSRRSSDEGTCSHLRIDAGVLERVQTAASGTTFRPTDSSVVSIESVDITEREDALSRHGRGKQPTLAKRCGMSCACTAECPRGIANRGLDARRRVTRPMLGLRRPSSGSNFSLKQSTPGSMLRRCTNRE